MWSLFRLAIFAGVAISVGGVVYLNVGGVAGACLFAFGLLTVVHYSLKLFTGTAGYVTKKTWGELGVILLGNIVGCIVVAQLIRFAEPSLVAGADAIVARRIASGAWRCAVLGVGCGLIMTTAVEFARKGQWLPLLFGVPTFILCGFTHSIADAFYYSLATPSVLCEDGWATLATYFATLVGNLAGCNLYRLFVCRQTKS